MDNVRNLATPAEQTLRQTQETKDQETFGQTLFKDISVQLNNTGINCRQI